MTNETTLIIPGFLGSEDAHWQSWIERQICSSYRVQQEWDKPGLSHWVEAIIQAIGSTNDRVWLLAHSFGCLAAVTAGLERADKVGGAMLIAPADPGRFTLQGIKNTQSADQESIQAMIPGEPLPFPSLVIASSNDPWMQSNKAQLWSSCWGSEFICLQNAGHINVEAGFGPWPEGLNYFKRFQETHQKALQYT
ncbi:RBBP9/YdeN family alpha/beta hydrolase [Polynucleobacter necessarius]|uniref:RBBP9/YdeN family alpha/beta hydrolase n=1 Tax=Polynucleobacter necessarius TaxID=576610 RepID=UPI000E095A0C|nr:alpha/beta hydrolase [Polynucleobacter necessarius]